MRRDWLRLSLLLCPGLALAACGHAPPPRPPPPQLQANTVADLAGTWVASGELDWGYKMIISAPETIDVWIDRGTMGRCEQKGTLAPAASHQFRITYTLGECNRQAVGVPLDMQVASFDGSSLTIVVAGQRRTYQRLAGGGGGHAAQ